MKHIPSIVMRSQINEAENISNVPHIRNGIRNNTKQQVFRREPHTMSLYLHAPVNIDNHVLHESSITRYMYFPRYIQ